MNEPELGWKMRWPEVMRTNLWPFCRWWHRGFLSLVRLGFAEKENLFRVFFVLIETLLSKVDELEREPYRRVQ